jgi:glutamyl-tRNA reductase
VADAFEAAKAAGSHGPILSHLFSYALHCGKRARTETAIGSHTISISHSAALLAEQKLGPLAQRQALVIGAGEMAELAALALEQHGVAAITCVNRTQERAERIAGRVRGRALGWGDLEEALHDADLVISATSAPHVILPAEQIAAVQARRGGRPLLLIDIALPRDIDVQVDAVAGVQRYDIDHLRDTIDTNLQRRQAAIPQVERIIAGEAACYLYWLNERKVVPTIVELRRRAAATADAELTRTLQKIKHHREHGIGGEELVEQEVAQMAHRIVAKLLHLPTVRLKAQAAHGNGSEYVQALAELFALETAPPAAAQAGGGTYTGTCTGACPATGPDACTGACAASSNSSAATGTDIFAATGSGTSAVPGNGAAAGSLVYLNGTGRHG